MTNGQMDTDPNSVSFFKFYGKDANGVLQRLLSQGVTCNFAATMEIMGKIATYNCMESGYGDFSLQLRCPSTMCSGAVCETDTATNCAMWFMVEAKNGPHAKDLIAKVKAP